MRSSPLLPSSYHIVAAILRCHHERRRENVVKCAARVLRRDIDFLAETKRKVFGTFEILLDILRSRTSHVHFLLTPNFVKVCKVKILLR